MFVRSLFAAAMSVLEMPRQLLSWRPVAVMCSAGYFLYGAGTAAACPFCSTQGQTLAGELASADMIVVATLKSSEQDAKDFTKSKSVFHIDTVIKAHPVYKAGDSFPVARYIQQVKKGEEPKFLLFCYVN